MNTLPTVANISMNPPRWPSADDFYHGNELKIKEREKLNEYPK
jgi:hypothetical protein